MEGIMSTNQHPSESGPDEKDYVDGAPGEPTNPVLALIHDIRYGTSGVRSRALRVVVLMSLLLYHGFHTV
jgi:hypothetical protein